MRRPRASGDWPSGTKRLALWHEYVAGYQAEFGAFTEEKDGRGGEAATRGRRSGDKRRQEAHRRAEEYRARKAEEYRAGKEAESA